MPLTNEEKADIQSTLGKLVAVIDRTIDDIDRVLEKSAKTARDIDQILQRQ